MKHVVRFLIRLYPAWWRRRYGRELEALLEDSGSRDVWDLFRAAMEMQMSKWSFGKIVTVCGIAGLVIAGIVAFSMPYRYQSTAVLKISRLDSDALSRVVAAAFTPQALSDIIRREHLYADSPTEDGIDRMRRAIRIRPAAPDLAQVSFAYEDPVQAQQVSRDLVGSIITANLSPANPNRQTILLLDPPDQGKKQIEHKRFAFAGLGLPAGLLFGVVLAWILRGRAPAH